VHLAHLVVLPGVVEDPPVTVVLPASMWAAMPMLRRFERSTMVIVLLRRLRNGGSWLAPER